MDPLAAEPTAFAASVGSGEATGCEQACARACAKNEHTLAGCARSCMQPSLLRWPPGRAAQDRRAPASTFCILAARPFSRHQRVSRVMERHGRQSSTQRMRRSTMAHPFERPSYDGPRTLSVVAAHDSIRRRLHVGAAQLTAETLLEPSQSLLAPIII